MNNKIVYIINFWCAINYGANLTAYALQTLISDLGYDSYFFDNRSLKTKFFEKKYYIGKFIKKYFKFKKFEREKDAILITGSDQVFNPNCGPASHDINMLNFAGLNNKKIAVSASFGVDKDILLSENSPEIIEKMKTSLKSFDFISVREQSGVEICKDVFDVDSELVIDPVFILQKEKWEHLAENKDYIFPDKLKNRKIVSYIFRRRKCHKEVYKYLSKKYKTQVLELEDFKYSPEDWLYAIKNCELFITNSFHGVCFALIFHKPFICISKGHSRNTRFDSLFKIFGINDQSISLNEIYEKDCVFNIDYDLIDNIIERERIKGKEFLIKSLASNSGNINENNIDKISTMENYINTLENQNNLKFQVKKFIKNIKEAIYFCCLHKPIKFLIDLFR